MTDLLELTGVILYAAPINEYDRRLVILTRERGRISAFAKGARRQNSTLIAVANPFVFGTFHFYEGRSSYTLKHIDVKAHFSTLKEDLDKLCYASYFTELAAYYSKENLTDPDLLNLMYLAFRTLEKDLIPQILCRYIFELRLMAIEGEYTEQPPMETGESAAYAWQYVLTSPLEKLFGFTLNEPALTQFCRSVEILRRRMIEEKFHSLEILESLS
ncbi:MAG: DNA repair protein RecO [Lachnospiraceae bacterium]|nr:DNA repair protein RecO [Lachnospiraceae bacterium]